MSCKSPPSNKHDFEADANGICTRLLPSIICQKCKDKDITMLEIKQQLAE